MRALFLIACLLSPTAALADNWSDLDNLDKQLSTCISDAGDNASNGECFTKYIKKADGILNKVYQGIISDYTTPTDNDDEYTKAYNEETTRRLKEAQRAWIPYRDAFCELRGVEMLDGSGEGMMIASCLFDETVRQTKALMDQFTPRPE